MSLSKPLSCSSSRRLQGTEIALNGSTRLSSFLPSFLTAAPFPVSYILITVEWSTIPSRPTCFIGDCPPSSVFLPSCWLRPPLPPQSGPNTPAHQQPGPSSPLSLSYPPASPAAAELPFPSNRMDLRNLHLLQHRAHIVPTHQVRQTQNLALVRSGTHVNTQPRKPQPSNQYLWKHCERWLEANQKLPKRLE